MAPRKKSKGKKPAETMRQRQMRLRKMEKQLKTAKKQLPPGKKGGALVKSGSSKPMSPRLKAALDKKAKAAKGTTGGTRAAGGRGLAKQTPRLPAGKSRFAKSAYGEDIQALKNLVKQGGKKGMAAARQLVKLGVKYAPAAKLLGLTAAKAAPGVALAAGVARSAGRPGAAKMSRLGGNAKVSKKSRSTSRKVGPKAVEGGYTISDKARKAAAEIKTTKTPQTKATTKATTKARTKPVTKSTQTRKPTKPKTSGVGPVKSGRSYSVGVSGKSVSQQRADELRQMQERSRKRQAEQKKAMAEAKKKREERRKQQQQKRNRR